MVFCKKRKMDRASGMTFIEITIVLIIIGILVTIVAPGAMRWIGTARRTKTEAMLRGIKTAIVMYRENTGEYPAELMDLVEKPSSGKAAKRWRGPYLDERDIEMDGHKNPFEYRRTTGAAHPYELYSWGPNGEGSPEEEWISVWDL